MLYIMKITKTESGYLFEEGTIVYRAMKRPKGFSFINGPNDLLGTFTTLEAMKNAFQRYTDKFADAAAIAANPLTPAAPDLSHGTILDERVEKYGLPPTSL